MEASSQLSCGICNKNFTNLTLLTVHKRSSLHRHTKELHNLMLKVNELEKKNSLLVKENSELERLLDESVDALFMYEMKLNGSQNYIPK